MKPCFMMRSLESFVNVDNSLLSVKRTSPEKYYLNIACNNKCVLDAVNFSR
jgi:hypothetical protein